jgi:putative transcriptional regulator
MRNDIAKLRSERSLTQDQLAEALGVSRQTVISIEKGRYDPSLPLAFKIADYFEIDNLKEIFHGSNGNGIAKR